MAADRLEFIACYLELVCILYLVSWESSDSTNSTFYSVDRKAMRSVISVVEMC